MTKDTKGVVGGIVEIDLNKKKALKCYQKSSGISNTKKMNEGRTYNLDGAIVAMEKRVDCKVDEGQFPRLDDVDRTCAIGHCYKKG
ncbi:9577_t:CDS:2, partial [Gigaspora margarita]